MSTQCIPEGCTVVISGLKSRPDLSGRVGKVLSYDAAADRYGVQIEGEHPMRIKATNVSDLQKMEERFSCGVDQLGGGPRCAWCRAPSAVQWVCKCEAGFCTEACRTLARHHGHSLLCKKGIASFEYRARQRLIVATLPRRAHAALDATARAFFTRGGADLAPGSVLVCGHVGGGADEFRTFRFAVKFIVAESCIDLGLGMLPYLYNKIALCTVAVRDGISPPGNRRANDRAIPRRAISLSLVGRDDTIEHVEVTYESPIAVPSGVQESVHIEGHVFTNDMGNTLPDRHVTLLTPARVHAFVYGTESVGVCSVQGLEPEPAGALAGGVAALFSSTPSLMNGVRLVSYDPPRWLVQPVRWDLKRMEWVEHKKKPTRLVPASDVCVDRVCAPDFPDVFKTVYKPGATADDVALMVFCTLPLQKRESIPITIVEQGEARPFTLPTSGIVMLPTPPAPFRFAELAQEIRSAGLDVIVRAAPSAGDVSTIISFVNAIDQEPASTAVLVERPADPSGFHAMHGILAGGLGKTMKQAAWLAFRGGDGRTGESMWVAGRPCHDLAAARRMVVSMTEDQECAICLERLTDGASQPLRCGHVYHLQCMFDVAQGGESGTLQQCALCRTRFRMSFMTTGHNHLQHFEDIDEFEVSRKWTLRQLDEGYARDVSRE